MVNEIEINIESNTQQTIDVDVKETVDYVDLKNKPTINGVELVGDVTTEDLGIEVDTSNLATKEELAGKADKSEIPTIPTKVSAFENDSGYLTEHQDISGKADKSDTYTKEEVDGLVPTVPTKTSELENDSGFITAEEVPETDLTGYLKNLNTNTNGLALGSSARRMSNSLSYGFAVKHYSTDMITYGNNISASGQYTALFGHNASSSSNYGAAFGCYSQSHLCGSALGYKAISNATRAIQLGEGTNSEAGTLKVALNTSHTATPPNYTLLTSDGQIPAERLPETSFFAPATNTWTAMSLGASNTEYEAPANGYFVLYAQQQDGNEKFISMRNKSTYGEVLGADHYWNTTFGAARLFVPAKKGHKVVVEYNCALTSLWFGFIPADGTS